MLWFAVARLHYDVRRVGYIFVRRVHGESEAVFARRGRCGRSNRYCRCQQFWRGEKASDVCRYSGPQWPRSAAARMVSAQDQASSGGDEEAKAECSPSADRNEHHLYHWIFPSFYRAPFGGVDSRVRRPCTFYP